MSTPFRTVFYKICGGLFFLYLAFNSSSGPAGHFEPEGSVYVAPVLILLSGALVIGGKWKKAHAHLVWGCFSLTIFLSIYRMYRYERTNAEFYRGESLPPTPSLASIGTLTGSAFRDRDFIIYEGSSFRAIQTHSVKTPQAIEAKNGARLEIEKGLAREQSDYGKKNLRHILDRWDYYVCQVIGMKKDGREIILLCFFPRAMQREEDLTKSEIRVMDGGPSIWTIEYDVAGHTYSSPQINGVA